jgi:hypothetical protein
LVFCGSFNTSLAFNFANPKITDEFARIAPGRHKSAAAFVLVMRLWPSPTLKLEPSCRGD